MNPFVSRITARLRPKAMSLNIVHDKDGLPRIILTEPTGSSAEVCFSFFFFWFYFFFILDVILLVVVDDVVSILREGFWV